MSTDRELLELAAKAVGIELEYRHGSDAYYYDDPETGREQWYPPEDDRQALLLASKLKFTLDFENGTVWGAGDLDMTALGKTSDQQPCMKRAVLIAAAEIGRSMP